MASSFRNYDNNFQVRKYDNSHNRIVGERSSSKKRDEHNKNIHAGGTPLQKKGLHVGTGASPRPSNNPYNFGLPQASININVNNLIINNNGNISSNQQPINSNLYPNNYGVYLSNSSVFSKLGSDIIGKGNNYRQKKVYNHNNPPMGGKVIGGGGKNASMKKNSFGGGGTVNLENVIANLIEETKDIRQKDLNYTPIIQSEKIQRKDCDKENQSQIQNDNIDLKESQQGLKDQQDQSEQSIQSQQQHVSMKESQLNCNHETLEMNCFIWETLFNIELNVENKQALAMYLKKILSFLGDHIPVNMLKQNSNVITFEIFSSPNLNSAYTKLLKIAFVLLIYLKFILLDFNYEMTLKSNIKKIINSLNMYLLMFIDTCVINKSGDKDSKGKNLNELGKEFADIYIKMSKVHHGKKPKDNSPQFGSFIEKNLEIVINHMKQMSNNFFKIGYFTPIHNICLEFFRLIESYSTMEIANHIINNVLFYVIHNNPLERHKDQSITNQQIVFNPTSLLNLCGFGNNLNTPYLPPAKDTTYTLVLDLDETLVHFFYTPSGGTFLIRPGCFEFLSEMSKYYDIAVFTAAMKDYADNILNLIDPDNKFIKYRLYRHHTSISGVSFVKDLTKLGRDLGRVIIIDNIGDNFKLQPLNGFDIKTFNEEMKDNHLKDFEVMLKGIFMKQPKDVRSIIKKIKDEVNKRNKKNSLASYANIDIDKYTIS